MIEPLVARVLFVGGRGPVDWKRSRLFFTTIHSPDQHASQERVVQADCPPLT